MRIFVTGGSGMLGHRFMRLASAHHQVFGSYHSHPVTITGCSLYGLDITNEAEVRSCFGLVQPEVVVHTAALTDVDECQKFPDKARRINGEGTAIVARVAQGLGALLVYISTDYVFNGSTGGYRESAAPDPVNEYGRSKLFGEQSARENCSRVAIIRTTMFGLKLPPRIGMMESMVAALRDGKPMTRFVDQYFTPLYTGQLSEVILHIAQRALTGLFHVGSADKVSRLEFCKQVAEVFGLSDSQILPGPFRQIDGLAPRPQDTSLICERIKTQMVMGLPTVREGLAGLKQDWLGVRREGMALH
jgi:dTDP-4-dehydrorhamnose reductase